MNKRAILTIFLAPLVLISLNTTKVNADQVKNDTDQTKAQTQESKKTEVTKKNVSSSKNISFDDKTQDSLDKQVKNDDSKKDDSDANKNSASSTSSSNDKESITGDDTVNNSSSSSSSSNEASSSSATVNVPTEVSTSAGETAVSINGVPTSSVSTVSSSDEIKNYENSNNNLIKTAMSLRGIPYVWGGTTTSGFDCSGYVQYVFAKNGINLPRTAAQQASATTSIPLSEAKAGDLLFWGSAGSEHHVAIYLGNNQFIDADMPGDVINVRNIYPSWLPTHAGRVN